MSFGLTLFFYAYGWLGFAGATNSSVKELNELLETFSLPLGMINGNFVLRLETPFWTALGICMANAYFYAILMLPAVRFVQWRMVANDVTQLGLSSKVSGFDTSEIGDPPEQNEHKPEENR